MNPINLYQINGHLTVHGNCQTCKERIEKAALSLEGVNAANWCVSDNSLSLSFDSRLTSLDQISKIVSQAGHNTNLHTACQETQKGMQDCCKS